VEEEEKEEAKEEKIQGRFLTLRFRNSDLGVVCHAAISSGG
jgi:hypothetical protein